MRLTLTDGFLALLDDARHLVCQLQDRSAIRYAAERSTRLGPPWRSAHLFAGSLAFLPTSFALTAEMPKARELSTMGGRAGLLASTSGMLIACSVGRTKYTFAMSPSLCVRLVPPVDTPPPSAYNSTSS